MRFSRPILNDRRTRTFFAILPVAIGREVRWLEYVTVYERYDPFYLIPWRKEKFIYKDRL